MVFGLFFLFPLYAMADFSTRNLIAGGRTGQAWANLVTDEALYQSIVVSLLLAVFTVVAMLVLLVPTMIWVRLRAPWAKGLVEFLCLLPLTIPALVIVVGLRNVYLWVTYLLGRVRADADVRLRGRGAAVRLPGASTRRCRRSTCRRCRRPPVRWAPAGPTTIARVVVPNIWSGILSAAFISIAVVLGEYTIASLTGYETLQVQIVADRQERRPDVGGGVVGDPAVRVRAAADPVPGHPRTTQPTEPRHRTGSNPVSRNASGVAVELTRPDPGVRQDQARSTV